MQLDMPKYSFWVKKISARGHPGGRSPPNVNLGPPISRKVLDIEN